MTAPDARTVTVPPAVPARALPSQIPPEVGSATSTPVPAARIPRSAAGTGTNRCADCIHLLSEHNIETKRRRCSIMHGPTCVPCECDGYQETT
jgi:hypothetical protein